jgi:hypothetical protein
MNRGTRREENLHGSLYSLDPPCRTTPKWIGNRVPVEHQKGHKENIVTVK